MNESTETNRTCNTCHWWFGSSWKPHRDMRHCVWHTGVLRSDKAKVHFGGQQALMTAGDFGCTEWSPDQRGTDGSTQQPE